MATVTPPPAHAGDPPIRSPESINEERTAEARKIFDEYEKEEPPMTTQTDQLRRSMDMEKVGPENWMKEQERRIRERQGEPPPEPRQVRGVAPVKPPTH
jgi:hypothetical protein